MEGFSLVEVMIAMVITGVVLLGTMSAVEVGSRHITQGGLSTRALALAQARLEAKRSVRWQSLLEDDLDHDGVPEVLMTDNGDGLYSAMREQNGVTLVWTLQADRGGPLSAAALVKIEAVASYAAPSGQKTVRLATLRANPSYVGPR
ncbi:type IV pilus modification PilV family protein [Nitrospira moscoviensis]|nr:prepilin-type N-terminal cleavage/methylation domain-containing protein [Nitrospira moscoviensis]